MKAEKLQARIQIERLRELVSDSGLVRQVWLPVLMTQAKLKEATTTEF